MTDKTSKPVAATNASTAKAGKPDADANKKLADFAKAKTDKDAKAAKAPKLDRSGRPKLPPLPRGKGAPKPEKPCECGCGLMTRSKFYPGHDSRLRGWALRVARGHIKLEDIKPPIAAEGEHDAVKAFIAQLKKEGKWEALKTPKAPTVKAKKDDDGE